MSDAHLNVKLKPVDETNPVPAKDTNGQSGVRTVYTTTPAPGPYTAVQVVEDTVFAAWTESGGSGDTLVGKTVPAGTTLFGSGISFTLTSGFVRAST